jgi:hypothetical protein
VGRSGLLDWSDYWGRYVGAVYGDETHLCGGLSYLYMLVLKAMGIQSRYVGIFDSIEHNYRSHVTVEVFVDGMWWISDPTFNTSVISSTGEYLNWKDIRADVPYSLTNEDHKKLWDVWIVKGQFTNYMIIFSVNINEIELVPSSWDGILENGNNLIPNQGNMYLDLMREEIP